jgi:hypothetical protein
MTLLRHLGNALLVALSTLIFCLLLMAVVL